MQWNFSLLFATWSQKSRLVILLLHSFNWFISTFYLLFKSLLKNQVYIFVEIGCVAPATFQVFVNNQSTLCRIFQHWRNCIDINQTIKFIQILLFLMFFFISDSISSFNAMVLSQTVWCWHWNNWTNSNLKIQSHLLSWFV